MTAPHVLMLSAAHPPEDLRVVGKEGAALAAAGWRVTHLCPGDPAAEPRCHAGVAIRCHARAPGWRGRLLGIPALARQARALEAAVIHASEPDAWLAAILAARGTATRVVLDVHEHYPSRLDPRLPAWLRPPARGAIRLACRLMARRAEAVVVAKDGLAGDFGVPDRTVAVRNYALPAPVSPRRHGPGAVTLVHLGAIGLSRGWPALLDALALAPAGTRLRIIGRFTDGSEAAFRARAEALGLAGRVEIHGWMPHAEALALAAQCDIGVVLFQPGERNHQLALPHKLFDTMLAGLPVIAPRFAGEVAAIIAGAGCGELVDPADPASVAQAIASLAGPARRAALGGAGREAALTRYSWTGEAERLVALYRRIAPLSAGGPNPNPAGAGSSG